MIRLTTVILIATFMQVSASSFGQRITLNAKNVPLEKVLKDIRTQSGYDFLFSEALINSSKPISIAVKNASIEEVLEKCFDDQPIVYKVENKTVLLRAKTPSILDKVVAAFAGMDVVGVVIDGDNVPLSGATVTVKGGKNSTTTGVSGQFNLKGIPEDAILQISFMGYVTKELKANGNLFGIKLELSTSKLDEVQVMAYGTTNRRLATGNISTVTAKEIEKQPVMNPLLALAGRVPGMVVTPTGGYASGTVKVEIRGRSAIDGKFTSDPLYIINGVPLTYLEIGGTSSYERGSSGIMQNGAGGVSGGQSPLFNLNPADISSIEVLKDADATAIYGSRGANGVILITTKRGKSGATTVTANVNQGITKVMRYWDLLGTNDYLQMRREAFKNDGIRPNEVNAPDLVLWDTTRYTNWQKELWGRSGQVTTASVALSGGSENTVFRIGGNFTRQTEILTASGANRTGNVDLSISNTSLDKRFRADLSLNYSYTGVTAIAIPGSATLAPNAPAIYNSAGELNFEGWDTGTTERLYPFATLKQAATSNTTLLTTNLKLSYELYKGLNFSTSFGYNNSHNMGTGTMPISSQDPRDLPLGGFSTGTNDNQNWIIEPQLNYQTSISKGRFTALVGASLQSTISSGQIISGYGYTDDSLLESIQLAPTTFTWDKFGRYKYAALYSRLNYTWDEKYIVNLSGRRDGSSRFGPGKQYGNFGAVGIAWIASQEEWLKNILPSYISFVKLRGSYGVTGSDAVGDYKYLTQWTNTAPGFQPVFSYGGVQPLVSQQAVNPNYQWQENRKLEGGLSLSFLKDQINLEVAYYRNRCDNQLTEIPIPMYTGFGTVTANWAANIQNSGWEASLSAKLINKGNFNWSVVLNGSVNKNILLSYPDIEHSPYANLYVVGEGLNTRYLLHYIGVDPMNGKYAFEDLNNDGLIGITGLPGSPGNDLSIKLNMDPKFIGGIGNEFQYKNLQFSFFFQYKNQMGINPLYGGFGPGAMANVSREMFEGRWTHPGQLAKYGRFSTNPGPDVSNVNTSDIAYTDASYLRLNNVSLSYFLPKSILKGNRQLSISLRAQNLWVITKYKGIDPDTQNFASMPTAKVITGGLSLTL